MVRQVAVRFDEDLYKALVRDAAANGRTVAQNIRHRLTQALASAEAKAAGPGTSNPATWRQNFLIGPPIVATSNTQNLEQR